MTRLELENAILDIIDNSDDLTRGDLQGVVEALAIQVIDNTMSIVKTIKDNNER